MAVVNSHARRRSFAINKIALTSAAIFKNDAGQCSGSYKCRRSA
jgi:hypothetical protein